jgi:glycerol dehydrogenase-like iron-containing ADH family enzyme
MFIICSILYVSSFIVGMRGPKNIHVSTPELANSLRTLIRAIGGGVDGSRILAILGSIVVIVTPTSKSFGSIMSLSLSIRLDFVCMDILNLFCFSIMRLLRVSLYSASGG